MHTYCIRLALAGRLRTMRSSATNLNKMKMKMKRKICNKLMKRKRKYPLHSHILSSTFLSLLKHSKSQSARVKRTSMHASCMQTALSLCFIRERALSSLFTFLILLFFFAFQPIFSFPFLIQDYYSLLIFRCAGAYSVASRADRQGLPLQLCMHPCEAVM